MQKILIIRFSSIGDLTQALSIPAFLKHYFPKAEIHFLTRSDLVEIAQLQPQISKVWSYDRKTKLKGIFQLAHELKTENYDLIYDAHHNLRSKLFSWLIPSKQKVTKKIDRFKRFMLLNFKKNYFETPFSGQRDLIKPLEQIGLKYFLPEAPVIKVNTDLKEKIKTYLESKGINLSQFVVLVPSAAYPLKRWPLEHFKKLTELLPQTQFVVLAGPQDTFTQELNSLAPMVTQMVTQTVTQTQNQNKTTTHLVNLTGELSLIESAAVIDLAQAVVSNDTGLLHISEQLGKPTIALMGPAPFGFPSRESTLILERKLACRPCSKHGQGPCINKNFQECLRSISPQEVSLYVSGILNGQLLIAQSKTPQTAPSQHTT